MSKFGQPIKKSSAVNPQLPQDSFILPDSRFGKGSPRGGDQDPLVYCNDECYGYVYFWYSESRQDVRRYLEGKGSFTLRVSDEKRKYCRSNELTPSEETIVSCGYSETSDDTTVADIINGTKPRKYSTATAKYDLNMVNMGKDRPEPKPHCDWGINHDGFECCYGGKDCDYTIRYNAVSDKYKTAHSEEDWDSDCQDHGICDIEGPDYVLDPGINALDIPGAIIKLAEDLIAVITKIKLSDEYDEWMNDCWVLGRGINPFGDNSEWWVLDTECVKEKIDYHVCGELEYVIDKFMEAHSCKVPGGY